MAHTINNTLDVIDCHTDHYLHSIPNLTGVAGALVSPIEDQIFTSIPVPGRTRWALYDHQTDAFYVNISDPAQIVVVDGNQADRVSRLYVASWEPGLIDVFDTDRMQLLETIPTEIGAHTIGYDPDRNKVYAFLPQTHRARVYQDEG